MFTQPLHIANFLRQVVQEFILAQSLLFVTKQDAFTTELLQATVESFRHVQEGWSAIPHDTSFYDDLRPLLDQAMRMSELLRCREIQLFSERKLKAQQHEINDLSLLACMLDLGRGRKCEDPRDRVYAMLDLTNKTFGITPDYTIHESVLVQDLIIETLRTGDTQLLHACGRRSQQTDLPSYVPDFEGSGEIPVSLHRSEFKFKTASKLTVDVKAKEANMISIKGLRVDGVKRTTDCREGMPGTYDEAAASIRKKFLNWMTSYNPGVPSRTSASVWGNFSSQMTSGSRWVSTQTPAPVASTPPYPHIPKSKIFTCIHSLDILVSRGDIFSRSENHYEVLRCTKHRHTFETHQGYLGLGPAWMEPGDQVVIFGGCVSPFIIRKSVDQRKNNGTETGERWKLIGDCYLLGWMHGDYFGHPVVDELPSQQEQDEHFAEPDAKKYLVKEWIDIC
jgi:hypothetical protein